LFVAVGGELVVAALEFAEDVVAAAGIAEAVVAAGIADIDIGAAAAGDLWTAVRMCR
jgi:hypothetical protein